MSASSSNVSVSSCFGAAALCVGGTSIDRRVRTASSFDARSAFTAAAAAPMWRSRREPFRPASRQRRLEEPGELRVPRLSGDHACRSCGNRDRDRAGGGVEEEVVAGGDDDEQHEGWIERAEDADERTPAVAE